MTGRRALRPTLGERVSRAVRLALVTTTAVGATGAVAQLLERPAEAGTVTAVVQDPHGDLAHRLARRHHCTSADVAGRFPHSALVLVHGHLRFVSFAEGWEMYDGTARTRGTLIAVCADPVSAHAGR